MQVRAGIAMLAGANQTLQNLPKWLVEVYARFMNMCTVCTGIMTFHQSELCARTSVKLIRFSASKALDTNYLVSRRQRTLMRKIVVPSITKDYN